MHNKISNTTFKTSTLVLELFSEEMPPSVQEDAAQNLSVNFISLLSKYQLSNGISINISDINITPFSTSNRLGIIVTGLPQPNDTIKVNSQEIRGPRINPNYNIKSLLNNNKNYGIDNHRADNIDILNVTEKAKKLNVEQDKKSPLIDVPLTNELQIYKKSVQGFINKYSIVNVDQLNEKEGFFYFQQPSKELTLQACLSVIIYQILHMVKWPTYMRWGNSELKWIRPLRNIMCIIDEIIIPIQFYHLTSNCYTYGHRVIRSGYHINYTDSYNIDLKFCNIVHIKCASSYEATMKLAFVDISRHSRNATIINAINAISNDKFQSTIGLNKLYTINADSEISCSTNTTTAIPHKYEITNEINENNKLLDEIIGMSEWPVVLLGKINEEFLSLPQEIISTVIKTHQKCLMLYEQETYVPSQYFIIVANNIPNDAGYEIIRGNEQVVSARLSDAKFFLEMDFKISLDSRIDYLKNMAFHVNLGNMYDKTLRMLNIAKKIIHCYIHNNDNNNVHIDNILITNLERAVFLSKIDLTTETVREFPELQATIGYYYAKAQNENEEIAIAIKEQYKPVGPYDIIPSSIIASIVALADKLDTLDQMFRAGIVPTGSKDPYGLRRAAIGVLRILENTQFKLSLSELGLNQDTIQFICTRFNQFEITLYDQANTRNYFKSVLL